MTNNKYVDTEERDEERLFFAKKKKQLNLLAGLLIFFGYFNK